MFGAAAMSLSSIFVVGNALRLRGFKSGFEKRGKTEATSSAEGSCEGKCAVEAGQEATGRKATEQENTEKGKGEKEMTKVMTIEGMMCGHCTGRVQKALEAVEGVKAVTMSLEDKSATVELTAEVSDEALTNAVTEAGYEVKKIQ